MVEVSAPDDVGREPTPPREVASGARQAGIGSAPLTVLFVDDDPGVLRAFVRTFGRKYALLTAGSGKEALEVLSSRPVDVIVTDYSMPGMSGADLLREVAAGHPGLGRVMLTAYADVPEVLECRAAELASAVLPKPWERAEAEGAIERAHRLATMRLAVLQMRKGISNA